MERFKIKCADLVFEIECRNKFSKQCCEKYIVSDDEKTDLIIVPDSESFRMVKNFLGEDRDEYIEFITLYHLLSKEITKFNASFLHAAAISVNGQGVAFTAPSGTGKTTHIRQWKKTFGNMISVVNGDKPLITLHSDGIYISGTPWCGKEKLSENISVPLKAICFLERGEKNSIEILEKKKVLSKIISSLSIPDIGSDNMCMLFKFINDIINNVEFYVLKCNISTEAACVAYAGIFEAEDRYES